MTVSTSSLTSSGRWARKEVRRPVVEEPFTTNAPMSQVTQVHQYICPAFVTEVERRKVSHLSVMRVWCSVALVFHRPRQWLTSTPNTTA